MTHVHNKTKLNVYIGASRSHAAAVPRTAADALSMALVPKHAVDLSARAPVQDDAVLQLAKDVDWRPHREHWVCFADALADIY